MNELLDIASHDFEEFEGKIVVIRSHKYRVGRFIGEGGEKFTFQLINMRSGLCLHLIKIYRVTEVTHRAAQRRATESVGVMMGLGLGRNTPHTIYVEGHGGAFQVQDYIGPYTPEGAQELSAMKQGDACASEGRLEEAIEYYQQVLEQNPSHSIALHNMAVTLARADREHEAIQFAGTAAEIDPLYYDYHDLYLKLAVQIGAIPICRRIYAVVKELFSYALPCDRLAARVELAAGFPENAVEILTGAPKLSESEEQGASEGDLAGEVQRAVAAKARADGPYRTAASMVAQAVPDWSKIVNLLREAHGAYPEYPLVAVNLGLALQKVGAFEEAAKMLLSRIGVSGRMVDNTALVNAALSKLAAGEVRRGCELMEAGVQSMAAMTSGSGADAISPWDFPGKALWFFDDGAATKEELPINALGVVEKAMLGYSSPSQVPQALRKAAELYRRCGAAD